MSKLHITTLKVSHSTRNHVGHATILNIKLMIVTKWPLKVQQSYSEAS